jgi:cardiolipin synthase
MFTKRPWQLARRWKQMSVLGSYLDPLGDKVFVASLAVALAAKGTLPVWLAACILAGLWGLGLGI